MSWKDDLGRVDFATSGGPSRRLIGASFRGVPFFVQSAELSGGRRTVTHEFPFRSEPFVEDLGRKARGFTVEGYVLGENYLFAKLALITELEAPGVGELEHPHYGTRRVMVDVFRVRETTRDGGMASFSIDFIETPAQPAQPTVVPDASATALASVAAARDATGAEFLARYNPGTSTRTLADSIRSATLTLNTKLGRVNQTVQAAALMKRRVDSMYAAAATLATTPVTLLLELAGVLDVLAGGFLSVYRYSPGERPPDTTANRQREQVAFDALQRLIQRRAVIRAAELAVQRASVDPTTAAPGEAFDSYEESLSIRTELAGLLDEQLETAGDESYAALLQLRADLTKAVPGAAAGLPRLVAYVPPLTVPSLVLAHRLYGNVDLEEDVLRRNGVKSPAFIPGGLALEVLSRG